MSNLKFDGGHDIHEGYITTQVMTATPVKLQLMLIQGALKNCLRARDDFRSEEYFAGGEMIIKTQEIFSEIIASAINGKESNPLSAKIVALYTFLFRNIVAAYREHDTHKLDEIIDILEIECGTWSQLCEKHGSLQSRETADTLASSGFSFEA